MEGTFYLFLNLQNINEFLLHFSLSRQSQSPLDYRKLSTNTNIGVYNYKPIAPPPPIRQHLELKTTDIVLNPLKQPCFQDNIFTPKNTLMNRSTSVEDSADAKLSKFCHECGYKFIVPTAKFCIECGVRRIKI